MKEIQLTRGKVALVDDEDFERVRLFKWQAQKSRRNGLWYAKRGVWKAEIKNNSTEFLHQFILGVRFVDHKDGDGLNCQKHNLRPATRQENARGAQRKRAGASSRYRGVCWNENRSLWEAWIKIDGKSVHLGRFVVEKTAAQAYDRAAKKYFGEFASTNF